MAEKSKRKIWTRDEVLMLLRCYQQRKDEFHHSRKKKNAYEHVFEDMVFQGFEDNSVTVSAIEGKMKTLLNAYKSAKDNRSQTGASPSVVPYMDEMDEIFGDRPIISNVHTIHIGDIPTLPVRNENTTAILTPLTAGEAENPEDPVVINTEIESSPTFSSSSSSDNVFCFDEEPSTSTQTLGRKRNLSKNPKNLYYQEKIKLKERQGNLKMQLMKRIQTGLEEKWKEELQILKESEEKKIKILENLAKK